MKKFIPIFFTSFFAFVLLVVPALAGTVTTFNNPNGYLNQQPYYDSSKDAYIMNFDTTKIAYIKHYNGSDPSSVSYYSTIQGPFSSGSYQVWDCNLYFKDVYYDYGGNIVGEVDFNADEIQNPVCKSGIDGNSSSGGQCTSGSCDIFDCPGWQQYMSKLDDIQSSIPPAPDWQQVANTFRDTIAPQVKSDLADVIGTTGSGGSVDPPQVPDVPDITTPDQPDMIGGYSDHGFKNEQPTTQEDPGLAQNSFNSDDIKGQAPQIQEREDPTGGFKVTDPMSGLCSLPTNDFPKPGQTNAGDCGQNKPTDQNPTPVNPADNPATPVAPKDDPATVPAAPTDQGGDYTAPTAPSDNTDPAPSPGDNTTTAPKPSDSGTDTGTRYYETSPSP